MKKQIPQSMLFSLFPFEFRFLWHKFSLLAAGKAKEVKTVQAYEYWTDIKFGPANLARTVYTVKNVRQNHVPWSQFEFYTPPKFEKFNNESLSVIQNRDRQRSAVLGLKKSVVR